ncbi:MAG: hypothetical protein JRI25_03595 [Deltaproteobacteria bacterium]|nr:hypothetical protein [Deltaproteobacteria bacterium]MBW2253662.1 hypothetical protein [Deltaproteobacteria bacterium]
MALFACSGTEDLPPCEGGGTPSALIGEDADGEFLAWEDGDSLVLSDDGGSTLGFWFDYRLTGLDATLPVTVVLRLSFDGGSSNDYLAQANLSCQDPGPARYTAFAALPAEYQSAPEGLDGTSAGVDTVFTDGRGVSADVVVDLVVDTGT